MKKTPLISVIVPIYKVEQYLDRCVESIVNQTYENLEIILVDDGSPDQCPAMCDAWAAKDRRIRVIHKENGGLSDARNTGMSAATGDLMGFVDSDDHISRDMYQLLYKNMVDNDSDISACGVEMVFEDGTPSQLLTKSGNCVLEQEKAMEAVVQESWLKQTVWYKLYKSDLIRDILFPVGKYHEDVFWTYQAVGRANRVSVFDKPCYFYLQRGGSIMGESYSLKRLDALDAKLARLHYIKERYPALISTAECDLQFFCLWSAQKILRCLPSGEKRDAMNKLQKTWDQFDDFKPRTLKEGIWLLFARYSLWTVARLRNMLHIGL